MNAREQFIRGFEAAADDICNVPRMDGDPSFEAEPPEEQHGAEVDLTWMSGMAPA